MSPNKTLLVEGRDDREVIYQINNYLNIPRGSYTVEAQGGFDGVLKWLEEQLPIRVKASESHYIGILVDADEDFDTHWQAITARLKQAGYQNFFDTPDKNGTLISAIGMPTVGVWLMPNNQLSGILEDFIGTLIPVDDTLWPIAKSCVDALPDPPRFKPSYTSKAYIHTWLAWQQEPGTPLGLAVTREYLDANATHAQAFLNWLRQLFDL